MADEQRSQPDGGADLLVLYDRALPMVYGYLMSRCRSVAVAEDLTAETFLAAVDMVKRNKVPDLTTAWLVGVARHKLADHWRRSARDERNLRAVAGTVTELDDPWDDAIDAARAHEVLGQLGAHHRAALTLRYLDGLPVADVANHLDRTLHATEALLVRARNAFRTAYAGAAESGPPDAEGGGRRA